MRRPVPPWKSFFNFWERKFALRASPSTEPSWTPKVTTLRRYLPRHTHTFIVMTIEPRNLLLPVALWQLSFTFCGSLNCAHCSWDTWVKPSTEYWLWQSLYPPDSHVVHLFGRRWNKILPCEGKKKKKPNWAQRLSHVRDGWYCCIRILNSVSLFLLQRIQREPTPCTLHTRTTRSCSMCRRCCLTHPTTNNRWGRRVQGFGVSSRAAPANGKQISALEAGARENP